MPRKLWIIVCLAGCSLTAASASPNAACDVRLTTPGPNAILAQRPVSGGKIETVWRFDWNPCQHATRYQLIVMGPQAINPLIDETTSETRYLYRSVSHGITSLNGWTWKVRAYANQAWGPWSTRSFNVQGAPTLAQAVATQAVTNGSPGPDQRTFYRGEERVCRFVSFANVSGNHRVELQASLNGKREDTDKDSFRDTTPQTRYNLWFCDKRPYGKWEERVFLDGVDMGSIKYSVINLDRGKVD